jgi:transcriptional regulator with XRE-family HTH domain
MSVSIALKVGRRIRELRERHRPALTQDALAERAGISVSFLSMIERGERCPHLVTLEQLATALAVELREFF